MKVNTSRKLLAGFRIWLVLRNLRNGPDQISRLAPSTARPFESQVRQVMFKSGASKQRKSNRRTNCILSYRAHRLHTILARSTNCPIDLAQSVSASTDQRESVLAAPVTAGFLGALVFPHKTWPLQGDTGALKRSLVAPEPAIPAVVLRAEATTD